MAHRVPRLLLAYFGLAALALALYSPALSGAFLWDDTDWIRDNPTLRSWHGLWRIWAEPGAVIQYYPLTYTTWWLDHLLWELSPLAMHIENVLLHALNALLFGTLLRRLSLPGATVAALVFLVHPVHVESVAWLVERKNTLSAAFYLAAAHGWLGWLEDGERRHLRRAQLLFAAALLAKTATLMLPLGLFALAWWRGADRRRTLRALAPFVALSLLAAVMTIVMERGEGAVGHDWALTIGERIALLGQVTGFYLDKLLLPWLLSFVYAKWDLAAASFVGWLPTIVLLAALGSALRVRRRALLAIGIALWLFVANLLPVSGLVDFYYLRYAYAADHFQYLPSLGPIALLCCGLAALLPLTPRRICAGLAVIALMPLAYATWQRAHIFVDVETLWRATLRVEPDAWLAHTNLGNLLDQRDGADAGIAHHRRAVAIYGDAFESNNAVGNYHARRGETDVARPYFDRALVARPDDPLTFNNLGAMAGIAGDLREALVWFEQGHRKAPDNRELLRNLVQVLAHSPDPALRDGPRALRLARQLNAVETPSLQDRFALFRALLLGGDRGEAIALGGEVLREARAAGDRDTERRVGQQLQRLEK